LYEAFVWACRALADKNGGFRPTQFGPCCKPNYTPASDPTRWSTFTTFLHGLVTELTTLYQPDTFWFDCLNRGERDTGLRGVT
jgi:hypothetical protein